VSTGVLPLPAEEITGLRDLAGGSVEWTELTGTGTLTNSSATLSVVPLTGAGNATFGGMIAGAVKLVKTGSGVQTLSTSNKGYTGWTLIGSNANLFRASDDAAAKRFLFKYNRGMLIVIHYSERGFH